MRNSIEFRNELVLLNRVSLTTVLRLSDIIVLTEQQVDRIEAKSSYEDLNIYVDSSEVPSLFAILCCTISIYIYRCTVVPCYSIITVHSLIDNSWFNMFFFFCF